MKNKNLSRTALISIFADIDKKISDLHECSAKDFKSLNIYLKDYYSKTSKISDNATTIFKMLSGEQGVMLRTNLELILNKITKSHTTINEKINESLLMLEKILAKAIFLTVSVKNFKQDLTTFKFMATNYKFISNYEQFSEDWNASVMVWEELVIELRKSLPAVEKRLDLLKSRLYQRISDLKANQRRSSASYSNLTKEIENCISLVSQKGKESDIQIPLLKQKTDNASQNIGNIITHLQYHDIIKQKIDHIPRLLTTCRSMVTPGTVKM